MRFERVSIAGIGYVVPNTEVTTASIESGLAALYSRLGIRTSSFCIFTSVPTLVCLWVRGFERFWAPCLQSVSWWLPDWVVVQRSALDAQRQQCVSLVEDVPHRNAASELKGAPVSTR